MDTNAVLTAIGSIGFPIVMCLLMGQYIMKVNESHKEESKYFTEALNKNTEALNKLHSFIELSFRKGQNNDN